MLEKLISHLSAWSPFKKVLSNKSNSTVDIHCHVMILDKPSDGICLTSKSGIYSIEIYKESENGVLFPTGEKHKMLAPYYVPYLLVGDVIKVSGKVGESFAINVPDEIRVASMELVPGDQLVFDSK